MKRGTAPILSVIIPTFNRKKILLKTLRALEAQSFFQKKFEVIVVDDGSTDKTRLALTPFISKTKLRIGYFRQKHQGQAIARNLGIVKARGRIVVFLGDDIIPQENLLKEHLEIHKKYPGVAVLGFIDWHPDLGSNKFMNFLAPNGPQFSFESIKNPRNVTYNFFYTSNISLESVWLKENKFDASFKGYGLEDIDLGYRLHKKGLKILYHPKAIAYHYHQITFDDYCRRSESIGKALIYFTKKHPELKDQWIKQPVWVVFGLSFLISKIPFLPKLNSNLYWLMAGTARKYRVLVKIIDS